MIQKLWSLLGAFPEKVPLRPQTIDDTEEPDFFVQTISYNVEDKERISSYLFLPKSKGPHPVVICHHQHQGNHFWGKEEPAGKIGDSDLALAPELARRGWAVWIPDALGYGDRKDPIDPVNFLYFQLASRLIRGQTLLAKNLHDLQVGIDYLTSRDNLNTEQLAFIGHSYGGRVGLWLGALDSRLKIIVSHCGCISYANATSPDKGIQLPFVVPHIYPAYDIEDVLQAISPRKVLLSGTTDDKWCERMETVFKLSKSKFPNDHLQLVRYSGKHKFTKPMRENAYHFLDNCL